MARYLGVLQFGIFALAVAVSRLSYRIFELGINTIITREVARNKNLTAKYLSNAFGIRTTALLILLLFLFFFTKLVAYNPLTSLVIFLIVIQQGLEEFYLIITSSFLAHEEIREVTILSAIGDIVKCCLGILLLINGYKLVSIVFFFLIISGIRLLFGLIVLSIRLIKPKISFDLDFWKNTIKISYPFAFGTIFVMIYFKIDSVMLSLMKGEEAVGFYNAAYNLTTGVGIIHAAFLPAIFPLLSRYFINSKDKFIKLFYNSFFLITTIGFIVCLILYLFAENIMILLYSKTYLESVYAFKILIWASFAIFIGNTCLVGLGSINRQKINMFILGLAALLNIALNLFLIPKYNFIGASYATLITEALVAFTTLIFILSFINKFPVQRKST